MTRINSLLVAAAIAAMGEKTPAMLAQAVNSKAPPRSRRQGQNAGSVSVGRRKSTKHPMNGAKECARRLRQIAAGTLRVST